MGTLICIGSALCANANYFHTLIRKNAFLRNTVCLGHNLVTVSHLKESDPVCNETYTSQALQRTKLELKRSKTRKVMRV